MKTSIGSGLALLFSILLLLLLVASIGYGVDDADADGVPDSFDNCITYPNGPLLGPIDVSNPYYIVQMDSDEDGYGNACDCDFNNDGGCGLDDTSRLLTSIGSANPADAELDMNGDGAPGLDDLTTKLQRVGFQPGPSGLACAAANQKFTCPPL